MSEIVIMKEIRGRNEEYALENRARLAADHVLMVNVMGAPGSGKTTLVKALCNELRARGIESGIKTNNYK